MKIFYFLIFSLSLPFSIQKIQAALFCEDYLEEVFKVDPTTLKQTQIEFGWDGDWITPYYFHELNADQGDIIRIRCRTEDENTCGGGCFLINNDCKCYSFNTDDRTIYGYEQREASLNNKQCNLELVRHVSDEGTYTYEHIIPLDVGGITCQNTLVTVPYAENYKLSLSNYISADFGLKNLEISIISNYNYFTLDGSKLNANNRFKILNELTFYSTESKKINVEFTNYGIFITGTKDCSFNIRVCHPLCSDCYDSDANDSNHQCTQC